jgi:hypothetical protein
MTLPISIEAAMSKKADSPQFGEGQAQRELDLWKTWKAHNEHPDFTKPLLDEFSGRIRQRANTWVPADVPEPVIKAEFVKRAIQSFRSYDPDKGPLKPWVDRNLQKAHRFFKTYQNPTRIVEARLDDKKRVFDNARSNLRNQNGREPSIQELSEELKWPEGEVIRALSEAKRKSLYATGGGEEGFDPTVVAPTRETEVAAFIRQELRPREQVVLEYLWGIGRPQLKPLEIAKEMKVSPSTITGIKQSITKKFQQYL